MGMKLEGKKLVITLQLKRPRLSNSGKSFLVGSTRGVKKSGILLRGKSVRYVANAFLKNEPRRSSQSPQSKEKTTGVNGRG